MDQGSAGDGGQNAVRLRCHDLPVLGDKKEVCSSGLLHLPTGSRIQIHILVKSLLMGCDNGMKTHGIVQPSLNIPRSVRRCPIEIADTDGQRFCAALEIGAYRGTENPELVFVRRLHPDHGIAAEHVGTQIKGGSAAIGRDVGRIGLHHLCNRVQETLSGKHRHLQPPCGGLHALRIQSRTKRNDMSVICSIRFQPLEYCLGILQNPRAFVQYNVCVLRKDALIPCPVLIIGHIPFFRLHISEAKIAPINVFLLRCHVLFPLSLC